MSLEGSITNCHLQFVGTRQNLQKNLIEFSGSNHSLDNTSAKEMPSTCYLVKQDVWTHCADSGSNSFEEPQCSVDIGRKGADFATVSVSVNTPTLIDVTSETHSIEQKCTNRCDIDISSHEIVSVTCGYKMKARFILPQNILAKCPFIFSSFPKLASLSAAVCLSTKYVKTLWAVLISFGILLCLTSVLSLKIFKPIIVPALTRFLTVFPKAKRAAKCPHC